MLGALVLAPVLLLTDIWNSPQLQHRPSPPAGGRGRGGGGWSPPSSPPPRSSRGARGWWRRWRCSRCPSASRSPPAAAPPTGAPPPTCSCRCTSSSPRRRWPGSTRRCAAPSAPERPDRRATPERADDLVDWVVRLLALYVVLYAIQAVVLAQLRAGAAEHGVLLRAVRAAAVPAARRCDWTAGWSAICLRVTVALALVFSLIGFFEYATKTIILSSKLVIANDLHTYFTVNSVFLDPDIFGRYLALAMILLAVALIYDFPQRVQASGDRGAGRAVGVPVAHAEPLEPRRAARRPGGAGGAALEAGAGAGGGGGGDRARRHRGGGVAQDLRAQPGDQRRLQRPGRPGQRRAVAVRRPPGVGLRLGLVRHRVPPPQPPHRHVAVGLAHHPHHGRRRAGPHRRAGLPRLRHLRRWCAWSGARAGTRCARRSPPRSSRWCSTPCSTPTSWRTRPPGSCSGIGLALAAAAAGARRRRVGAPAVSRRPRRRCRVPEADRVLRRRPTASTRRSSRSCSWARSSSSSGASSSF